MAEFQFQTEVNQLLQLIIHSLYSHKEIFLRELISNASDALDKLKYRSLTDDELKDLKFEPRIDISFHEKDPKTLTISDTGIGMSKQELIDNLGTIARSGTKEFLTKLSGDAKKDVNLIGQFGVGFYSSFMVADKVEVVSKKAGTKHAHKWISDGVSGFELKDDERKQVGTTITLFLNDNGQEYSTRWEIESVIKKYSDHIPFPIFLHWEEEEGEKKDKKIVQKEEQINTVTALWQRPKTDLKEKDYNEFYKTISHDSEDPLLYIHTKAEGKIEYTTLFYVPKKAPFDMYFPNFKSGVKLYVKRVFITDDEKELIPTYLRFLKGIIDSEDLPLNVSREILQQNKTLAAIKSASVKKVLEEIKKLSEDKTKYIEFITEYNRPLKEGIYQDFVNKDILLELIRFKSTKADGFISLAEYKERMKPDQKAIYYISGENKQNLKNSPLLEAYKVKDIEVLIMDDDIDELIIPSIGKYKDVDIKSVNRTDTSEDLKTEIDKDQEKIIEPLIKKMNDILKDDVKKVKASTRLSDSPSCIVADENDPTIQMQHLYKMMGQKGMPEVKPILEINPNHEIIKKLINVEDKEILENASRLLLDQALLIEGVVLKDPNTFAKSLNKIIDKAL